MHAKTIALYGAAAALVMIALILLIRKRKQAYERSTHFMFEAEAALKSSSHVAITVKWGKIDPAPFALTIHAGGMRKTFMTTDAAQGGTHTFELDQKDVTLDHLIPVRAVAVDRFDRVCGLETAPVPNPWTHPGGFVPKFKYHDPVLV